MPFLNVAVAYASVVILLMLSSPSHAAEVPGKTLLKNEVEAYIEKLPICNCDRPEEASTGFHPFQRSSTTCKNIPFFPSAQPYRSALQKAAAEYLAAPWVVQGLRFLAGYVAGKTLDAGIESIRQFLSGAQQQAGQVGQLSSRSDRRALNQLSRTFAQAEAIFQQQGSTRAKQQAIQYELNRLEQAVGDLARFTRRLEQQIENIERTNRIQFERIESIESKLEALQRNDARQDKAIVTMKRQDAEQDRRLDELEARRRRADMFAELSGIFQSTYDFTGGEHVGIHGAIQGNATDYLGIYVAYDYAPHYASEPFVVIDDVAIDGTTFWQNHTVSAGFKVSLTPPRLPFNIQVGAGGGLLLGALRVTTTGNIFAPKTSSKIGSSTQPVATFSTDVALGKTDWQLVPFFSGQHILLYDALQYGDISSLGRRMWNVGVGLRLRGHIK